MCAEPRLVHRARRGLSLVELLVGLVVSMLILLAAFGVGTTFGASQRQSVSASATSADLHSALAALKAEVAPAALGFVVAGTSRCARWNYSQAGTVVADNAPFVPFMATRDAGTAGDRLDLVLTSSVGAAAAVRLAAPAAASDGSLVLQGWMPVQAGEQVLVAPAAPGSACTVRDVTGTVDGPPFVVQLGPASYAEPTGGYVPDDTVSAIGRIDRRRVELDSGGRLVMTSSWVGSAPSVLAEGVVAWRVQYGVASDTPGASALEWVHPVGPWATLDADTARRVRALRLGLVARSPQLEKGCQATTTLPQLFGTVVDVAAADPAGWQCHRYRRAEVVVVLRNIAWGQP